MKKIILGAALLGAMAFSHGQVNGAKVFQVTCVGCHGVKGENVTSSFGAINTLSQEKIEARLKQARDAEDKNKMDRVGSTLTEEQAKAVAQYVSNELK